MQRNPPPLPIPLLPQTVPSIKLAQSKIFHLQMQTRHPPIHPHKNIHHPISTPGLPQLRIQSQRINRMGLHSLPQRENGHLLDPGYQFIPGLLLYVSIQHFSRGAVETL